MNLAEMSQADCTELCQILAKRHGLDKIPVLIRKRLISGTFKTNLNHDTGIYNKNPRIFLAEHLWTGQHHASRKINKRRGGRGVSSIRPEQILHLETGPVHRLHVVLHECAHMVHCLTRPEDYSKDVVESHHGPVWRKINDILHREYGYRIIYKNLFSGYEEYLINLQTGTKIETRIHAKIERL